MPLAANLVDDEYDHFWSADFKAAAAVVRRVRRAISTGTTLERALEEYLAESDRYPEILSHVMAFRYYLQALFTDLSHRFGERRGDGTTAYFDLVEQLERWRRRSGGRVLYVCFNYDTLLEQALVSYLAARFEALDRYLTATWALIKVHGSQNWAQEIRKPDDPTWLPMEPADVIAAAAEGLTPRPGWHVLGEVNQTYLYEPAPRNTAVAPLIAIPVAAKSDAAWACPPSHLSRMREWLPSASALLTIGWKGQEPHFVKELTAVSSGVPLTVVTRHDPSASQVVRLDPADTRLDWPRKAGLSGPVTLLRTGFSGFVSGEHLEEFITALR